MCDRSATPPGGPVSRRYPALDVHGPSEEPGGLSLVDTVAVVVDDHSPFALEETDPGQVRVYFTSDADRDAAHTAVSSVCGPRVRTRTSQVADDDWAARSQADLRAIRVGRVVVAPPWNLPPRPREATDVVVEIHPALGFGSGHHATTRLALRGLQQLDLRNCHVLDLGTGSGVLAIAAVKLGARRATGIDRDPDALASGRDSVRANNVTTAVELQERTVSELEPVAVPVLIANLTGATLTRLASLITTLVEPGGHLVLAGILAPEEHAVAAAYGHGARLVWRGVEDEWVGMVWERTPARQGGRSKYERGTKATSGSGPLPSSSSPVAPDVLQHRHGADHHRVGA